MKKKPLTLDETHAALSELLFEFDRICRKHGLRYSLDGGTMLGAIRHKGFIPWDDDVDVCMPRPDYEKFIGIVNGGGETEEHFVLSADRGKHGSYPFVKLMDKRYVVKCSNHIEVPYLFLDVFPLDGMPDGEKAIEKEYKKDFRTAAFLLIAKWYTVENKWGFLLYIFGFWLYLIAACIGQAHFVKKLNRMALKYPYETSGIVGVRSWGRPKNCMPRESFDHTVEVDFEGRMLLTIADYDRYLTQKYGNYMRLPPEKHRKTQHCMKIYRV